MQSLNMSPKLGKPPCLNDINLTHFLLFCCSMLDMHVYLICNKRHDLPSALGPTHTHRGIVNVCVCVCVNTLPQ
jgi:hypothetical protein